MCFVGLSEPYYKKVCIDPGMLLVFFVENDFGKTITSLFFSGVSLISVFSIKPRTASGSTAVAVAPCDARGSPAGPPDGPSHGPLGLRLKRRQPHGMLREAGYLQRTGGHLGELRLTAPQIAFVIFV